MSDIKPEWVDELARVRYERFDSHFSMPGGLSWEQYKADDPEVAEGVYLADAANDLAAVVPLIQAEHEAEVERLRREVAVIQSIVYSDKADEFRADAAFGRVALPYASNRYLRLLDDLRAALDNPDDAVREVKAEAWAEGHGAGGRDVLGNHGLTPNPYRDEQGGRA